MKVKIHAIEKEEKPEDCALKNIPCLTGKINENVFTWLDFSKLRDC